MTGVSRDQLRFDSIFPPPPPPIGQKGECDRQALIFHKAEVDICTVEEWPASTNHKVSDFVKPQHLRTNSRDKVNEEHFN